MKRKWALGAIILPCPNNNTTPVLNPFQIDDQMDPCLFNELTTLSPSTIPFSLFKGRISLHAITHCGKTLFAAIPGVGDLITKDNGRLYLTILCPLKGYLVQAFLSCSGMISPLHGLTLLDQFPMISSNDDIPHFLFFDRQRRLRKILPGYYLDQSNIRQNWEATTKHQEGLPIYTNS